MSNGYHDQKINGARIIESEIRTLAEEQGFEGLEIIWDNGALIIDSARHEIVVQYASNVISEHFSDEDLADYPERDGTDLTRQKIRHIVSRIEQDA